MLQLRLSKPLFISNRCEEIAGQLEDLKDGNEVKNKVIAAIRQVSKFFHVGIVFKHFFLTSLSSCIVSQLLSVSSTLLLLFILAI